MAKQIGKKWIADGAIDGSKIKLLEGQSLVIEVSGQEVELLKVAENGNAVLPQGEVPSAQAVNDAIATEVTALNTQIQTDIQDQIAAETTAREAAIISVEQSVAAETTARESAITSVEQSVLAETQARESAITSVEQSVVAETQARESAIQTVEQSVLAETQARESAITSVEQSVVAETQARESAIQTVEQSVQTAQTDISGIESELAQEILDRQSGDASTLSSAQSYTDTKVAEIVNSAPETLDTLNELAQALGSDPNFATTVATQIGSIDSKIDQEILDRQSADSSEATARENADIALDSRLSPVENRELFKKYSLYNDSAAVFSNGKAGVEDPSAITRDGWYFQNTDANDVIGWYFYDKTLSHSPSIAKSELSAFAVMTFDAVGTNGAKPIFGVYSYPTGTNDAYPGYFHSRWSYQMSQTTLNSMVAGKKVLLYIGQNPEVHPELEHHELELVPFASLGEKLDTETIGFVSFNSDTTTVNKVKWLVESLGVESSQYRQESELKIRHAEKSVIEAALASETSSRISGDASTLQDAKDYTDAQIAAIPPVDLSSYYTKTEVDAKESALASDISDLDAYAQDIRVDLDSEISNRQSADASNLQEAKDYADQKVAALVNSAPEVLDTLKELSDALGGDENFSVTVAGQIGAVDSKVDQEILDRQAADNALDARLNLLEVFGLDQIIHVAKNGLDSNSGKQHSPFLTITAALNAISDASPTKRYALKVAPGNYSEAISLKANVFIVGEGQKESVRITGAVSMHSSFSGTGDHRSGFSNVTLLSAADFNWSTVTSGAGKLYFNETVFGSTVNMYGHNNAIAQAQFNSCILFGHLTISGINVGVFTNNVSFSNITLNQHPNGGMATILNATGGYCNTLTQTAPVNDFNRRSASFLRNFNCEKLVLNGPSVYADADLVSQGKQTPDILDGANIIAFNPRINHDLTTKMIVPGSNNSHNSGDWGMQWFFNFAYVHASSGTDLYLTSVGGSYDPAGDDSGRSIFIESDGYGLKQDVNGGNISIKTANTSGTGVRGNIVLDGKEIDATNKQVKNLADGTDASDAINKAQLDSAVSTLGASVSGLQSQIDTEKDRITALENAPDAVIFEEDIKFEVDGINVNSTHIDLSHLAKAILKVSVNRLNAFKNQDYTVSEVGGVTRITWENDLAANGLSEIAGGDVIYVTYAR
jgi:hypothetical protein